MGTSCRASSRDFGGKASAPNLGTAETGSDSTSTASDMADGVKAGTELAEKWRGSGFGETRESAEARVQINCRDTRTRSFSRVNKINSGGEQLSKASGESIARNYRMYEMKCQNLLHLNRFPL